jgi:hypothetical protein
MLILEMAVCIHVRFDYLKIRNERSKKATASYRFYDKQNVIIVIIIHSKRKIFAKNFCQKTETNEWTH